MKHCCFIIAIGAGGDDGSRAGLIEPYTVYPPYGSDNPRDLWKYMAAYEEKTGGDVLAIAHNAT